MRHPWSFLSCLLVGAVVQAAPAKSLDALTGLRIPARQAEYRLARLDGRVVVYQFRQGFPVRVSSEALDLKEGTAALGQWPGKPEGRPLERSVSWRQLKAYLQRKELQPGPDEALFLGRLVRDGRRGGGPELLFPDGEGHLPNAGLPLLTDQPVPQDGELLVLGHLETDMPSTGQRDAAGLRARRILWLGRSGYGAALPAGGSGLPTEATR